MPEAGTCVFGLAPHSGWAAAVILGGTASAPRVLARERLELFDARQPESKQPYHAIESLPLALAQARLAGFEATAAALAAQGLRRLMQRSAALGATPRAAGILDANGRGSADLGAILRSHALIHTADGEHYRAALEHACGPLALRVARVPRRELTARAAATLQRAPPALAARVQELGRGFGAPWGADQKAATLLAWLLLATA
jgi:hypothetical protein